MKPRKTARLCLLSAGLALVLACTQSRLAGSISETTNGGVAGVIVEQGGAGAGQARVVLLPVDNDPVKNPGAVSADTTDSLGTFAFSNVPMGAYALQVISFDKKTSVLVRKINIGDHPDTLAADTLRPPGAIKVILPATADAVNGYVYVPGTVCFSRLKNSSGYVMLDSVPVDLSADIAYSATNIPGSTVLRYGVPIKSGDTAVVGNPGWNYSRKITFNTTASGANVTGSVTNFPVLIRLTAANFDFTQAKNNGEDISFTKQDNTVLSYEIERWDPVKKLAEVWVKVDTVHGDDSAQHIDFYWGNSNATDESNGTAVFDTSAGFQGVWHLNENGNDIAVDATANHFNGNAYHMADNSLTSGAIGKAHVFDGDSSYIIMLGTADGKLNFSENGYFTISAWVYADALDTAYHSIMAKGFKQYFLWLTNFSPSFSNQPSWEFSNFSAADNWHMSTCPATGKQWVLITGVKQGSDQSLYCNGELVAGTSNTYPQGTSRDTSSDLTVGRFFKEATFPANFGYCYFKGGIDEVRICNIARNADWIRLCFMNQRSDDKLVQFK